MGGRAGPALARGRGPAIRGADRPRVSGRQQGIGEARQRIGGLGGQVLIYAAGAPHAATQQFLATARACEGQSICARFAAESARTAPSRRAKMRQNVTSVPAAVLQIAEVALPRGPLFARFKRTLVDRRPRPERKSFPPLAHSTVVRCKILPFRRSSSVGRGSVSARSGVYSEVIPGIVRALMNGYVAP
jgi:hypothetical protein